MQNILVKGVEIDMGKTLGKFCSVANYNELIIPKTFPGYITPPPQALKEDGQKIQFKYTPIKYNIKYNLDGGEFKDSTEKKTYTVEDTYTPPVPVKEGYTFVNWSPDKIPSGTMVDDFTFTAKWAVNAQLCTGKELNEIFDLLVNAQDVLLSHVSAIRNSLVPPGESDTAVDISTTTNEIKAWYNKDANVILIYCKDTIYCNPDMSSAFKGMSNLMYIADMAKWVCPEGANIKDLFKDCVMLADLRGVNDWANGIFSDFTGAFDGTVALESGRVPLWYRWTSTVKYVSKSGKVLADDMVADLIPGQLVYAKNINGYNYIVPSIRIDAPNTVYVFEYEPIIYEIFYNIDDATLENPKVAYTIEDETYYPPQPYKDGATFISWKPLCLPAGTSNNFTFTAIFQ